MFAVIIFSFEVISKFIFIFFNFSTIKDLVQFKLCKRCSETWLSAELSEHAAQVATE